MQGTLMLELRNAPKRYSSISVWGMRCKVRAAA